MCVKPQLIKGKLDIRTVMSGPRPITSCVRVQKKRTKRKLIDATYGQDIWGMLRTCMRILSVKMES